MATPYGMHDHGRGLIDLFSGWLYHLSRSRRRKIFRIHRLDRRRLLPNTGFARSACLRDVASGDFDAYPGFSAPMGPAQTDRALDDSNLAVRFSHRCACLFNALQVVSSRNVMQRILPVRRQTLALGKYLMFDHDALPRVQERLW